ncbi:hypothetical protein [Limimaricola soesokkakensis]|uniref:hypothetical protein n=1 Tax=Limimaricola soesokkakensis TaxID=1343159 RepID=UPI003517A35C
MHHAGVTFVVGYEKSAHVPGHVRANIRLHGPDSVWSPAAIKGFGINTEVVAIVP